MSLPLDEPPIAYRSASWRERVALLGVGLLGNHAMALSFDYLLYPFMLWHLGLLYGCITMTTLSALVCYLTLIFYDWSKKDWLGIETVKSLKQSEGKGPVTRFIGKLMRRGDGVAFVALTLYFDPFITVAYLRPGSFQFNGLTRREWGVFWGSVLISNLFWSFVAFTGVTMFRWVWEHLAG